MLVVNQIENVSSDSVENLSKNKFILMLNVNVILKCYPNPFDSLDQVKQYPTIF